jgi:hypothetical protein
MSEDFQKVLVGKGQACNGGLVSGKVVFSTEEAMQLAARHSVILCIEKLDWSDEKAMKVRLICQRWQLGLKGVTIVYIGCGRCDYP